MMLEGAGFEVSHLVAFNRLGVLGWLVGKWTGQVTIRTWQARLFGLLLPLARVVERIRVLPGLSWVAIAVKK